MLKALIVANTHEHVFIGADYDEAYLFDLPTIECEDKKVIVRVPRKDDYVKFTVGEVIYDEYGTPHVEFTVLDIDQIDEMVEKARKGGM